MATTVVNAKIDSTWKITNESTDLCRLGGSPADTEAGQSPYSKNPNTFTCGAMAATLLACTLDGTGHALCIQDYDDRVGVRFPTAVKKIKPASGGPAPLQVKLADGTTFSAQSHDQAQHYDGRNSWLWRGDSPHQVLLLPKGDDGTTPHYFDKTTAGWTAQLSTDAHAPTTVAVKSVTYAS